MWTATTTHAADLCDNKEASNSRESSSVFPRRLAHQCSTRCANRWSMLSRNSRTDARTCVNPRIDSLVDLEHADEQKLARDPVQILGSTEWQWRPLVPE